MLNLNLVSPGYYETLRIPRIDGRDFTGSDRIGTMAVAIVNAQLARTIAPTGSAIGKQIRLTDGEDMKPFTVVGVVGDAKHFVVSEHQLDQAYIPIAQRPLIFTEAVLRTDGDPAAVGNAAREAIWRVDPDQPVWRIRPLTQSIGAALGAREFMLRLLAGFTILAVLLAMIGIYGVTAYAVAGRTQEMGIRMALGARAQQVVRLVVRQSMKTIGIAIVVGLGVAAGAARLMQSLLFGIGTTDPVVYAAVPVALGLVALVACWLPARRASRVDPVTTLRAD
jgi:putative ABC transport system permease protein